MKPSTSVSVVAVGALLVAGCQQLDDRSQARPAPVTNAEASGLPSTAEESGAALAALPIAPERHEDSYDRDDWPHWISVDGCDTRARVLESRAHANAEFETSEDCVVTAGAWTDIFGGHDAPPLTDPDEVQVDHVVPLAEVHRSGGHDWSTQQRRDYANAAGPDDIVLQPVAASDNASKSDADPAEWMPTDECLYAGMWIDIKTTYALSVDEAEHDALRAALATCPTR